MPSSDVKNIVVKFHCDHTATRTSRSATFDQFMVQAIAKKLCADCTKRQERRRLAMIAEADERTKISVGTIALTGSEKQIAWANDIRCRVRSAVIAQCMKMIAAMDSGVTTQQRQNAVLAAHLSALDNLLQ